MADFKITVDSRPSRTTARLHYLSLLSEMKRYEYWMEKTNLLLTKTNLCRKTGSKCKLQGNSNETTAPHENPFPEVINYRFSFNHFHSLLHLSPSIGSIKMPGDLCMLSTIPIYEWKCVCVFGCDWTERSSTVSATKAPIFLFKMPHF